MRSTAQWEHSSPPVRCGDQGGDSVRLCFFFQAEDGIRGRDVTGVQTCALPISWKEAVAERPSRCTTCSFVSTYEVSPSVATTTPLAVRSTFPRTRTSIRTLWRSAFCTTLLFSLLAKAGRAKSASAAAAMRKVNEPPPELPLFPTVQGAGSIPDSPPKLAE